MTPPYTIGAKSREKVWLLAEAQNWRCAYCGIRCHGEHGAWDQATRDHVVPVVAFGLHVWENEIMACALCNNGRGAMYARAYLVAVGAHGSVEGVQVGDEQAEKTIGSEGCA